MDGAKDEAKRVEFDGQTVCRAERSALGWGGINIIDSSVASN